jgi:AcrR family transcriptional regulator
MTQQAAGPPATVGTESRNTAGTPAPAGAARETGGASAPPGTAAGETTGETTGTPAPAGAATGETRGPLAPAGTAAGETTSTPAPAGAAAGDARREQMLRAAVEVICERGFADTRIADVAERAGTSPALVIYYFKTKDQLLAEALRYSEDQWYAEGQRRMAKLPSAAARLQELVAMCCLPEADPTPNPTWVLWLDFWSLAARSPEVAGDREKNDERWREIISSLVTEGQEAGEFLQVDPGAFAITLSAMLDGLAIQIALRDPVVDPVTAFTLTMRFAAGQLGFDWEPERAAGTGQARGR